MPAKLASPVKVEYARLDLDDLLSRLEDPQGFFDRSPILLTACRDRLFLGDGDGGLQVAKQLKIAKVRARIEYYEGEDEAHLAAVDASYIINSARGRVPPHSRVSYAAFLKSRGLPAKAVAARMKIDEKTVYHLWKISESAELMEKLRKGEISLREAVNLAYAVSRGGEEESHA